MRELGLGLPREAGGEMSEDMVEGPYQGWTVAQAVGAWV